MCLLAEFDGRRVVLAGDGHAEILAYSLAKLRRNGRSIKLDRLQGFASRQPGNRFCRVDEANAMQRFLISTDGSNTSIRMMRPSPAY